MQITLDPELEQGLHSKVASGEYPSPEAALNEALRRFLQPEQDRDDPLPLEEMRRELMIAEEEVKQGLVSPLDMDAIIAEGHKVLAARRAAKS